MRNLTPAIGCLALLVSAGAASAVTLTISSATVDAPGQRGEICVGLDSEGAAVAGTQNDLVWDGFCATLRTPGDCRIDPTTDKQLHVGFPPQYDFTVRALVLSLSDVDPIRDGVLYCCEFIAEAEPGQCCPIDIVRAEASDPAGRAVPVSIAGDADLCVAGGGTPRPTGTPLPSHDDDGCQVAPATAVGWQPISLALAAVLALRRWRARRPS